MEQETYYLQEPTSSRCRDSDLIRIIKLVPESLPPEDTFFSAKMLENRVKGIRICYGTPLKCYFGAADDLQTPNTDSSSVVNQHLYPEKHFRNHRGGDLVGQSKESEAKRSSRMCLRPPQQRRSFDSKFSDFSPCSGAFTLKSVKPKCP